MNMATEVLEIFHSQSDSQSRSKFKIIQSNLHRFLPKPFQPDIIILAQVVLEIFCSQALHCLVLEKSGKGDNLFMD